MTAAFTQKTESIALATILPSDDEIKRYLDENYGILHAMRIVQPMPVDELISIAANHLAPLGWYAVVSDGLISWHTEPNWSAIEDDREWF